MHPLLFAFQRAMNKMPCEQNSSTICQARFSSQHGIQSLWRPFRLMNLVLPIADPSLARLPARITSCDRTRNVILEDTPLIRPDSLHADVRGGACSLAEAEPTNSKSFTCESMSFPNTSDMKKFRLEFRRLEGLAGKQSHVSFPTAALRFCWDESCFGSPFSIPYFVTR